jgi:hypothetical protein
MLTLSVSAQSPTDGRKPPRGIPADAEFFNGKWYKLYNQSIRWNTARQKCITLGGQLAIVPDQATWDFIRQRVHNALFWLGATDEGSVGNWKWIDGTPMSFKAWLPGEPNNDQGKEHYLSTWKGWWNDVKIDGKFPRGQAEHVIGYICEWSGK